MTTAGGWRFLAPFEGQHVWLRADGVWAVRGASGWARGAIVGETLVRDGVQVVGARRAAIAGPTGGSTIDVEARATLAAVLAALRDHGLIASA